MLLTLKLPVSSYLEDMKFGIDASNTPSSQPDTGTTQAFIKWGQEHTLSGGASQAYQLTRSPSQVEVIEGEDTVLLGPWSGWHVGKLTQR
jgi:hypothetical protein